MRAPFYLFAYCAAALLMSCQRESKTVELEIPAMRPSSIYKGADVLATIYATGENRKEMAASYSRKSKEAEARNLDKAIYYIKRAITLNPELGYYRQLESLLQKKGQYQELQQLYDLLITQERATNLQGSEWMYLFGPPDEEIFYGYLSNYWLQNHYLPYEAIYDAGELNIKPANLKNRFLADKRLKLNPESEEYKNLMLAFLTDEEQKELINSEGLFRNFLASIKDTARVFELTARDLSQFTYVRNYYEADFGQPDYSSLFIHFLPEKQKQPNSWVTYNLKRRIHLNDSVQAVLYAIDTSATACPAEMRHIYYRLATYSSSGKIIHSEVVAKQAGEQLSTLNFVNNRFAITDHKRIWKNPYNNSDFDNYLVRTEKLGHRSYEITPAGHILLQEPMALADQDQDL